MSIARAFTKRSKRVEISSPAPLPARNGTVKNLTGKEVTGSMISSPAFISTTNTLALNAPNVESIRALRSKSSSISSTSSASSADESDKSSTHSRSRDTQFTDASSVENSPTASPGTSHTESFFPTAKTQAALQKPRRSASSVDLRSKPTTPETTPEMPELPVRAPSHSKKAHEILARKRSLQQMSSHSSMHSASSSIGSLRRDTRPLLEPFGPVPEEPQQPTPTTPHPFGKELEQLDEVAEEFGDAVQDLERSADIKTMRTRNLARFCAAEYIADLQPLYLQCFGAPMRPIPPVDNGGGWI